MPRIIGFPNPVNEVAARSVAGGVVVLSVATLVLSIVAGPGWLWLSAVLAYGFVARVLTGPKLSPLGQLATRVIAPRLGHEKLVPGPPKRFAQGMGATMTLAAVVVLALGHPLGAQIFLSLIVVAATLESVFAICLGCHAFAALMRVGIIPESVCEACADIRLRQPQAA